MVLMAPALVAQDDVEAQDGVEAQEPVEVPPTGGNQKGRYLEPGSRARISFNVGEKSPISGGVQETFRPFDEFREEGSPQEPESFTFAELGLSESESTYGLSFEYQWKWVTLFIDATYMDADVTGVAPRDLFIGVKSIQFEGREYEYQAIPEGTSYEGTIDFLALSTRMAITPVTVNAGGDAEFVPWIMVGLFTLGGDISVDAGPATGIQLYENPPREYVVGGSGSGDAVAVAPEIGIGGELKFRTGERARLLFRGNYSFFEFSGSTGDLGVSARNEKDIDLSYNALDLSASYEFPMSKGAKFVIGAHFRSTDASGSVTAEEATPEEVVERREKFNKNVDFRIETFVLNFGFRF
jgi:hypothetical protein